MPLSDDPVVDAIINARVAMLFSAPFFGQIALSLKPTDATKWCPTAATDGRHLFYNRDFIKSLKPKELEFLVAHEIGHCLFDHLGRCGDRNKEIFNMAADYMINYTLVKNKIGDKPKVALYDEKFTDEMTTDEIYDILIKSTTKVKMTLDMHLDLGKDDKGQDQGKPMPGSGDQDGKVGGKVEVDVTVMNPGNNGEDGPPQLSEEDLEQIRNQLRARAIQAAQSMGAGKVPAGIRRLIDELCEPVLNWRELLRQNLQSLIRDDYSFQRVNKRSWSLGVILPGSLFQDKPEVEIAIDTSGSMTADMLKDLLTEIRGIVETFQDFVVHVSSVDTKVYNRQTFTPENVDELTEYELVGGGGTDLGKFWDFMVDEQIQPNQVVFFSDGLTNSWGTDDYHTLWIIHSDVGRRIQPPHGTVVHYES